MSPAREFICKEHLPDGGYYVVYAIKYHPGNDVEEAAHREEEERQILETIAALERVEKNHPGSVYGGVMQTVAMVTAMSQGPAGGKENGYSEGEGSSSGGVGTAARGNGNGNGFIDLTSSKGGDGVIDLTGGDGGNSDAAGGDDDMAWLKNVSYSDDDDDWVGGFVNSDSE